MENAVYENYFTNRGIGEVKAYVPRYLTFLKNYPKDIKILDIGCGMGNLMLGLKQDGFVNLTGIDVSTDAITYCKSMNLECKVVDILNYQENSLEKYDIVFMNHVLEHLPKEKMIAAVKFIKENLMKQKGIFVCTVPNAQSNTGAYWAFEDFTHETLFTSGSLQFVLKSAGFEEVKLLDLNGTEGLGFVKKIVRITLLKGYKCNKKFWNMVTGSLYHGESEDVYTFDVKACAVNNI